MESTGFPWDQLLLKLLDWPFLMFVIVMVLIYLLKEQIKGLVDRSNLKITWGDRSIELNELADSVDQDIDPLKERLDELETQLEKLAKNVHKPRVDTPRRINVDGAKVAEAVTNNSRYKYRTARGVAKTVGITTEQAKKALQSNPDIKSVRSRDGRILYTGKR
ncbi:hypothetical protein OL330_004662 [Vibrio parahaemolyticus]|uniref:hypothetical protein n=1 Tax=Vibrio parahaemolyticus TaxID=670 RepID=UPI0015C0215C|nr:hypothetical protein [Vibrio parahaemolyticus]EKA7375356.1 hypothetical protein [Vibrio parahaemolyticus]ELA9378181.1 hypothetical protein [Vibrio parahaemolyticus]ELK8488256.1 hypothetical protein [Vibrio parahaemolyticus]QLE30616.1 hypothetical protein FDV78_08575 [Vibrio parahaemolyticus]HCG6066008.1 hypothetical protein [Vibrio parahaemolyticus]